MFCIIMHFFFFKQKTAYEMRISDWSSDVCASDLSSGLGRHFALTLAKAGAAVAVGARRADKLAELVDEITATGGTAVAVNLDVGQRASEMGSAAWRERVCTYVEISVEAG